MSQLSKSDRSLGRSGIGGSTALLLAGVGHGPIPWIRVAAAHYSADIVEKGGRTEEIESPKDLWQFTSKAFLPCMAAVEVVKRAVPAFDLRYFDGGHFVLDEYADAIAEAIIETFSR